MALLHMDSFDHYGDDETQMTKGMYLDVDGAALSTTQARTGTRSLFMSGGAELRTVLEDRPDTAGFGLSLWFDSLPGVSDRASFFFRDRNNATNIQLGIDTTGAIAVKLPGFGTLDTSAPVLTTGAWQHVEARAKIHASAGEVEIRVNGVTVLALSGVDTLSDFGGTFAEIAQIALESGSGITVTPYYVDDFFIWDTTGSNNNDFLGDRRVLTDVAIQDTAIADWQLSAGSNGFELIDELPPDDGTTYIFAEFDAIGDQSAFEFEPIPSDVSSIAGVQLIARTIKDNAGPCTVQVSMIGEYAESNGEERAITSVWTDRKDIFETDPDTGAPFTKEGLSGTLCAIRRTA